MSFSLHIFDEELVPLVSKNYGGSIYADSTASILKSHLNLNDHTQASIPPVINWDCWRFAHIKRDYLYIVCVTHESCDRICDYMTILFYLESFYQLLKSYIGVSSLDRNVILDNTLLTLELFEESMDYGIVQVTEPSIIKDYIRIKVNLPEKKGQLSDTDSENENTSVKVNGKTKIPSVSNQKEANTTNPLVPTKEPKQAIFRTLDSTKHRVFQRLGLKKKKSLSSSVQFADTDDVDSEQYMNSDIAKTTVLPISWRTKGIHYAKNEFFLDVIEEVEYLMDFTNKTVKKSFIYGRLLCKSYLSGMPTLRVAINKILTNDEQFMSQVKFHQCVSLDSLKSLQENKEIEFIPPDGEFVLCTYELKRHVKDPPMINLINFEIKPKLLKYKLQVFAEIEPNFKATNLTSLLIVRIPLDKVFANWNIDLSKKIRFKTESGKVLFNIDDDFLLWDLGAINGRRHTDKDKKISMTAEFTLFNEEEHEKLQRELLQSMNPPPPREGPKLEELYKQTHEKKIREEGRRMNSLVSMKFEIPYLTCSGLKIEFLKIEEDQLQYQALPWVRYKSLNHDDYAFII